MPVGSIGAWQGLRAGNEERKGIWKQTWTADGGSVMSQGEMLLGDSQKYLKGTLQEDGVPREPIGTKVREV